jgi:hypothetical protein
MKVKSKVKAGIDTVPLPERPVALTGLRKQLVCGIGTWPTPE